VSHLKQFFLPPKILRDNGLYKAGFGEEVTTARRKTGFYKEHTGYEAPAMIQEQYQAVSPLHEQPFQLLFYRAR
jgi:hypothetical protein